MQSEVKEKEKHLKTAGRPHIPVDWDKVNQLIMAQCTIEEVAGNVGMHRATFGEKIKEKYGVDFTTYATELRSKGKSLLRSKQYQKAMEGNIQMLLRLGEIYLDQGKEAKQEDTVITATFKDHMDLVSSVQSERKMAETSIKAEHKSD